MTFGQALQTLAEMYPRKFSAKILNTRSDGSGVDAMFFLFGTERVKEWNENPSPVDFFDTYSGVNGLTQDDIDTILAEVNHYYEISLAPPDQHVPEPAWTYIAHEHNGCCNCLHGGVIPYKDKLSASKAALIAVVEKLEGEKK